MLTESRNIYQNAREKKGVTQEKAAELIEISVESIRAYEGGRRIPPDDIVLRMSDVYGVPYLAYQHLKTAAVGRQLLPDIQLKGLSEAALSAIKELDDCMRCREDLIDIACDGKVTPDEMPRYQQIVKEFEESAGAGMALKFARTG